MQNPKSSNDFNIYMIKHALNGVRNAKAHWPLCISPFVVEETEFQYSCTHKFIIY